MQKNIILVHVILLAIIMPFRSDAQITLEPIILVPGIMGSWNSDVILSNKTGEGTWDFFPLDHTWDNVISALVNAGYEKDKTLFVAFYDWRQSNINSATDYLIPTIDKALLNSPTGKVDIIAHSMGGLVSRRYIQSNNYRDDVDQLILLGTPNYGSSDVYTIWEAGFVPKNWEVGIRFLIDGIIDILNVKDITIDDEYDTVHKYFPSVGELLPTYDFLTDSGGNKPYSSLIEAQNPFLENLNLSENMQNLFGLGFITVIAGKGEGTVGDIPVAVQPPSETKLWKDGIPVPFPPERNSAEGDNRVLLSSAFLDEFSLLPPQPSQNFLQKLFAQILPMIYAAFEGDLDGFLEQKEINSKHGDLPTTAIPEVFNSLGLAQPPISYTPPPEPDNIISFWFASPVDVKVIDPNGKIITKNSNNIAEAVYTGESDPNGVKLVIIPNGVPGDYKVELIGTADGEYHMAASVFSDTNDSIVTVEKSIAEGEKVEYIIDIDQDGLVPIEISAPVITEPQSDSAIDLTNALLVLLKKYYDEGKIKDKGLYQSLQNDLKIILATLKKAELTRPIGEKHPKLHKVKVKLLEKLAIKKLRSFIATAKKQSSKGKIDPTAVSNLVAQAEGIIAKID